MDKIENNKSKTMVERGKNFWEKHKRKIYIVGGVLVVCLGGYCLVKYLPHDLKTTMPFSLEREEKEILKLVTNSVSDVVEELEPIIEKELKEIPVNPCIVNLPRGWKASDRSLANAARAGVLDQIAEGQTYRQGCRRKIAA